MEAFVSCPQLSSTGILECLSLTLTTRWNIHDDYITTEASFKWLRWAINSVRSCNTLVRMCGTLISGLVNRFSSFPSWKKISFHRPVSIREHRWNLAKGVLDHLSAILAVYLCVCFFLSYSKIGCGRGKVRREVYEAARVESCFRLEAGLYPTKERKGQKNSRMRITKGYLWPETSMKAGRM